MKERGISLLIPSRERPARLRELLQSIINTTHNLNNLQFCLGFDLDDPYQRDYENMLNYFDNKIQITYHLSDGRMSAPDHLNGMASTIANGDLLFALGDDCIFRTPDWDVAVNALWDTTPDNILIAYCNDGRNRQKCEHFIMHTDWLEQTGNKICPSIFRHFCIDSWVEDIAIRIGRLRCLSQVVVEHMHFKYGKSERDNTYAYIREPIGNTSVSEIDTRMFQKTDVDRFRIAKELQEYIDFHAKSQLPK